jgi:hypothetical protein
MSATPRPPLRLTSLLRVEERLKEAEYFGRRLFDAPDSTILGYELNAFLSAARSVTFLVQKEFARVAGFEAWWSTERARLGADSAARFFLELRNISQKEGPVSVVGAGDADGKWRYMFAGNAMPVPADLINRDVADCCLDHLAKLAKSVLQLAEAFPFQSCPARALTPQGVVSLSLDLDEVERVILGLAPAVSAARPEMPIEDRTRIYRRYVDAVDFVEIRRIADYSPLPPMEGSADFGLSLGISMVEHVERARSEGVSHGDAAKIAIISEWLSREQGNH